MKAKKRQFLSGDDILKFNASNNFEIERHFSPINLDFDNNTLNLWVQDSSTIIPNSIIVEAIYYDFSKNIEKYETVEYIEVFDVPLTKEGILKPNEFSIPIKLKENTKVLWKINLKIKSKIDCDLRIMLS